MLEGGAVVGVDAVLVVELFGAGVEEVEDAGGELVDGLVY